MKKSTFITILIPVVMVLFMICLPLLIIYAPEEVLDMLPIVVPVAFIVLFGAIWILVYYSNRANGGGVVLKPVPKQTVDEKSKEAICPHCGEFIGYGDRDCCPSCGKKIDDRML